MVGTDKGNLGPKVFFIWDEKGTLNPDIVEDVKRRGSAV
jgi:hypothetical protein